MDTKIIVEKALKGEDYLKDIETLDDEQKAAVRIEIKKAAEAAADEELKKLTGLRQAVKATEDKGKDTKNAETTLLEKFKSEQYEKAKSKFFSDPRFSFKDEKEKEAVINEFGRINSGSMDAELIFNDLKKAFALVNSESLLESRDKFTEFQKNAANFNAFQANASGGSGGPEDDKYSKAAKDLYLEWQKKGFKGKTLDDAQKLVDAGEGWRERNLA